MPRRPAQARGEDAGTGDDARRRTLAEAREEARRAWAASLPQPVRPQALLRSLPRIADRLVDLWASPVGTVAYLDSLLIVDRAQRCGFPVEVGWELIRLREHCAAFVETRVPVGARPRARTAFDWNDDSRRA